MKTSSHTGLTCPHEEQEWKMLSRPHPCLSVRRWFFPFASPWGKKLSRPRLLIEEFPAVNQDRDLLSSLETTMVLFDHGLIKKLYVIKWRREIFIKKKKKNKITPFSVTYIIVLNRHRCPCFSVANAAAPLVFLI